MDLPRPFGPYTLQRRLAVGGMAEVYVAKAKGIGGFEKLVAIKVIHPRYSEDDHFVQMLVEEAKLSVLLTHVNVAQTFDLGCIDDTYFIVMELVEGADAYKLLKRAAERPAQVPLDLCAYIASEMCQGLDYAHRKRDMTGAPLRIVHRDISPQNVLVSFAGEVKIVDFGIAKAALRSANTEVGVIKGKYYYMSPEQAWADPVDHRSDIFSTGIVLHELLTGRMVYEEDNLPKLLDRVRKAEIPRPSKLRPEVPPELDEIVMRALAKHPEERYGSAHDFGQALTQFLYGHLPSFTPARLAGLMAQLFATERTSAGSAASLPSSSAKVLSSIHTAQTPTGPPSSEVMRAEEFRPDPAKSVIFDLGADFGDEQTSAQLPKAVAARRKARQSGSWEDESTSREVPSEASTTPIGAPEDSTWEDATVVDDSDDLMDRMRGLLERQVAEKNRQAPASEEATIPRDRDEIPAHVLADDRAPRSVPPPPPTSGALAAARLGPPPGPARISAPPPAPPPPRPSAASVWPPGPPTAGSGPSVAPGQLPDLSWQDGTEGQGGVQPRPSAASVDTFQLAAMQDVAARKSRRKWFIGLALAALVVAAVFAVRSLATPVEAPPRLEVRSVPPGARVFFGGEQRTGTTPLVVEDGIEAGQTYMVQVQLDGYEAWSSQYEARAGAPVSQIAVLVPIRVDVTVRTEPAGGQVWVDGVDHGTSPVTLQRLPVGRELRLRAQVEGREVRETRPVPTEGGEIVLSP